MSKNFRISVGVRQGFMMSLWLFDIHMGGCMREIQVRVGVSGTKLTTDDVEQPLVGSLFVDDTVLLAESKSELQKVGDEFNRSCRKKNLEQILQKESIVF